MMLPRLIAVFFNLFNKQMNYTALNFRIDPASDLTREIIIAELSQKGFEGFLETENGVVGYIENELFKEIKKSGFDFLNNLDYGQITVEEEFILEKNWNELWESNYDAVVISDQVLIKAPFHHIDERYKYEIIIEPKMSFGTGHHATTALMMENMLSLNFDGKTVLDMGCGTGVLSILASKMGALSVLAVDLNEWAYENTIENVRNNDLSNIRVMLGDCDLIQDKKFDYILANITKTVILENFSKFAQALSENGIILLSGFLIDDLDDIKNACNNYRLIYHSMMQKKDWIAMKFSRI